jgi:predicted RNA-binding protein YlxR (DUF448 family)
MPDLGRERPIRMCVGCRRRYGPDMLFRLAIGADGRLMTGRQVPGRGAWVCAATSACFDRAVAKNALTHALRAPVSSDDAQRVRSVVFVAETPDVRDYGVARVY